MPSHPHARLAAIVVLLGLLTSLGCAARPPLTAADGPAPGDAGGPTPTPADAAPADVAAAPDAAATDGVGPAPETGRPCAVTTASGTTVPCTDALVSFSLENAYCGLKAGQLRCWSNDEFFDNQLAGLIARAPPGLVRIVAGETLADDPSFCGLDAQGNGTCWGANTMTNLGGGLASVVLSRYGRCALHRDGRVDCAGNFPMLPSNHHYVQIAVAADFLIGLDDAGTPVTVSPYPATPAGVYRRVGILGGTGAALRDDGTLVYMQSPAPVVFPGAFVDFTFQYLYQLCGIDRVGDVACFPLAPSSLAPLVPPPGPFVQIVAGSKTMCGLRSTGTTTCWGDLPIPVPEGW